MTNCSMLGRVMVAMLCVGDGGCVGAMSQGLEGIRLERKGCGISLSFLDTDVSLYCVFACQCVMLWIDMRDCKLYDCFCLLVLVG